MDLAGAGEHRFGQPQSHRQSLAGEFFSALLHLALRVLRALGV